MRCEEVAAALPGLVDDETPNLAVERHVESCLRCQAELARYRRLLRTAHALRSRSLEPPAGSLAEMLAALELAGDRHGTRPGGRRLAYAGAIGGTAVAAGAATAAVLIARARRRSSLLAAG